MKMLRKNVRFLVKPLVILSFLFSNIAIAYTNIIPWSIGLPAASNLTSNSMNCTTGPVTIYLIGAYPGAASSYSGWSESSNNGDGDSKGLHNWLSPASPTTPLPNFCPGQYTVTYNFFLHGVEGGGHGGCGGYDCGFQVLLTTENGTVIFNESGTFRDYAGRQTANNPSVYTNRIWKTSDGPLGAVYIVVESGWIDPSNLVITYSQPL
ncbi:MAG: hypothetical protein P4M14_10170 [Gammaproteobacteria bacterium]|nr:hypothetical protein [Gammaproteobacteria bacterium]